MPKLVSPARNSTRGSTVGIGSCSSRSSVNDGLSQNLDVPFFGFLLQVGCLAASFKVGLLLDLFWCSVINCKTGGIPRSGDIICHSGDSPWPVWVIRARTTSKVNIEVEVRSTR